MRHPDMNDYWTHVLEQYPDARFCFWYDTVGELLFYPDEAAENADHPYSCIWRNRQFAIVTEF